MDFIDIMSVLDIPVTIAFAVYAVTRMSTALAECRQSQERAMNAIVELLRERLKTP